MAQASGLLKKIARRFHPKALSRGGHHTAAVEAEIRIP